MAAARLWSSRVAPDLHNPTGTCYRALPVPARAPPPPRVMPYAATVHWTEYQVAVADALTQLGCSTTIEEALPGVRAVHKVDVCARFVRYGIMQLWAVECKTLARPVTKEKVLTLQQIVADVGADRGVMFCETGFQAGAVRAARTSNVTLTSLSDFLESSDEQRQQLELQGDELRSADLANRLHACYSPMIVKGGDECRARTYRIVSSGIDAIVIAGHLGMLRSCLERIRLDMLRGAAPSYQSPRWGEDRLRVSRNWSELHFDANRLLDSLQILVEALEQMNQK